MASTVKTGLVYVSAGDVAVGLSFSTCLRLEIRIAVDHLGIDPILSRDHLGPIRRSTDEAHKFPLFRGAESRQDLSESQTPEPNHRNTDALVEGQAIGGPLEGRSVGAVQGGKLTIPWRRYPSRFPSRSPSRLKDRREPRPRGLLRSTALSAVVPDRTSHRFLEATRSAAVKSPSCEATWGVAQCRR